LFIQKFLTFKAKQKSLNKLLYWQGGKWIIETIIYINLLGN
jgi:hypothetical protein